MAKRARKQPGAGQSLLRLGQGEAGLENSSEVAFVVLDHAVEPPSGYLYFRRLCRPAPGELRPSATEP